MSNAYVGEPCSQEVWLKRAMLTGPIAYHVSLAFRKHRQVSPWCLRALVSTSVAAVSAKCERGHRPAVGAMDLPDGFSTANFVYAASVGLVGWAAVLLLQSIMKVLNTECIEATPSGLTFEDPDSPSKLPVPSIHSDPAKTITVVFPAYNEGSRLKAAVDEAVEYLTLKRKRDSRFSYEIIIVDDGSTDDTYAKAMKFVQRYGLDTVRVLRLPVNKGKGAAVRAGILAGRGETLLFADSDGATQFCDVDKLSTKLDSISKGVGKSGQESTAASAFQTVADRHGMVIGSRAHLEHTAAVAKRHWGRNLLMHGFHFLVLLVAGPGVKDTQCGFKVCSACLPCPLVIVP